LLVKAQRLGLRIGEVAALPLERKQGTSRFRVLMALGVSPLVFYAPDLAAAPAETVILKALA
jgi:hypothetical protein